MLVQNATGQVYSALYCFFFLTTPLPCEHYYSIWAQSVLLRQPPVSPVHHHETGLTSTAVGWVEDEQTRLSLICSCRHAKCMSTINTWSANLRRCESQWCNTSTERVSAGSKTEVIVFFFLLPVGMLWRNVCLSVCPERNTGCFAEV